MSSSVQPVLVTRDLERLAGFYRSLLGAVETERVPADGPTFYVGLRIGDSDMGVVAVGDAPDGPQRMLLSIAVPDVDALLPLVEECGGHVEGPGNDMPWGQRVAHVQDPDGNSVNLTADLGPDAFDEAGPPGHLRPRRGAGLPAARLAGEENRRTLCSRGSPSSVTDV